MAGSAFWGTVFLAVFAASSGGDAANFEVILLHTNDMHARFEQTTALSSRCTDADAEANRCYGGMARVASEVRKARARAASGEGPNVLFLNAGDTYQGTVWYTFHKWRIVTRFINLLAFDAIVSLLYISAELVSFQTFSQKGIFYFSPSLTTQLDYTPMY
uniref:5'-nucleotidase n=1 Tax=Timema shepardi TaxID=629360 RepID=A0A7R9B7B2_TIMSH|nr:unnamed protein product [Timema shepardi]